MILQRTIKPTITPFELNKEDSLHLTLSRGEKWGYMLSYKTNPLGNTRIWYRDLSRAIK